MSRICYGCMRIIGDEDEQCPHCGFDRNIRQSLPFLPLGAKLQKDRYIIGKKLGSNNESTRYIALDASREARVIVREFLPNGLCSRSKDGTIKVREEKVAVYKRLLNKYLDYNRTLARLKDCSAACNIIDIFMEHNTAYVVEEKEEMSPFSEYIKQHGGHLTWEDAKPLFLPLLATLEAMHKNGISHYGVGPGNVKITKDGRLKLQNFSIADMRKVGTELRPMMISGCSAPEQYEKYAVLDESTDIYGFTAVLFYALTGSVPEDVEKRRDDNKLMINSSINKKLPAHVKAALASGLQFDQEKRMQTFDELRAKLSDAPSVNAIRKEMSQPDLDDDDDDDDTEDKKKKKKSSGSSLPGIISCIVSLVLFVIIGTYWLQGNPFAAMFSPSDVSSDSDAEGVTGETVTVPNFVGVKYEEAAEKSEKTSDYKLLKAVEEEFSNEVPEGYIASQFPEAYSEEVQGYSLYITVSKGAKMRQLPEISGKTVDQTAQLLGDESFVTTQSFEYSDSVKKGLVIGYDAHNPGDKLEYGSPVEIKVSLGVDTSKDSDSDKNKKKKSSDSDAEEESSAVEEWE